MKEIVLKEITVEANRVDYYFNVDKKLQKYFNEENHLFFQFNYNIEDIPKSILTIPFVSNVAPLAWLTNSKVIIPELDQSFYESIHDIKKAYQNMYPKFIFKGKIEVSKLEKNSYIPKYEAAQLFSGGLDALATYIRIKDKNPFLITEFGWHSNNIEQSEVWEEDRKHVIKFAKEQNLNNLLVQSNYGTFIKAQIIDKEFRKKIGDTWWHGLHHGLAIISAGVPVAFKLKIECIYIASSLFQGYKAPIASDPSVDNNFRFASGRVFHDAYELHRQDKIKVVIDYCLNKKQKIELRVCHLNKENCCNCEKCVRTILGIIAEGKNPKDFGFKKDIEISSHVYNFLEGNIKFFQPGKIMLWELSQNRMRENRHNLHCGDLLDWFLDYNFVKERRSSLIKYRITKFFPIVKRKIRTQLSSMLPRSN